MAFTKEIVDFTGLDHDSIQSKLSELNIPLSTDEALMIQNEMLGRPPSLTELILFSIQGSEHCSYKSSRQHLKQFVTDGPDVVLGAKEDAGVVAVATDNDGNRWCIIQFIYIHFWLCNSQRLYRPAYIDRRRDSDSNIRNV